MPQNEFKSPSRKPPDFLANFSFFSLQSQNVEELPKRIALGARLFDIREVADLHRAIREACNHFQL
ncbi:hypothetical protein G5556_07145, partial [Pseudomonas aeruginosa]|nr:hypothetical protein [Pseudomonas aeruginosa]